MGSGAPPLPSQYEGGGGRIGRIAHHMCALSGVGSKLPLLLLNLC